MKNLRIILYDQLSHEISSLSDIDKVEDIGDLGKQLVLVFFEDASEQMIYSNCQGG